MQEFVSKKNLTETLRRMKKGEEMVVNERDFKIETGHAAKYRLRKEGIEIKITQKDMIGKWKAIRLS